jgi:hypothetical protein
MPAYVATPQTKPLGNIRASSYVQKDFTWRENIRSDDRTQRQSGAQGYPASVDKNLMASDLGYRTSPHVEVKRHDVINQHIKELEGIRKEERRKRKETERTLSKLQAAATSLMGASGSF